MVNNKFQKIVGFIGFIIFVIGYFYYENSIAKDKELINNKILEINFTGIIDSVYVAKMSHGSVTILLIPI